MKKQYSIALGFVNLLFALAIASCSKNSSTPPSSNNNNNNNLSIGFISTVAGNGSNTYNGDSLATLAGMDPYSVCIDTAGNLYIADSWNNRIRKVFPNGKITTIAGNGKGGFSGDGGQATAAQLNWPEGICLDKNGNLYIADYLNNRVRKVSTNGIISTVAGTSNIILGNGDGGLASSATLSGPYGLCIDKLGNLFIADYYDHRIRKVSTTGIITTYAGSTKTSFSGDGGLATAAGFFYPYGICMDTSGNLYISDDFDHRIRKVSSNGIISTISGTGQLGFMGDGGSATNAQFEFPEGLCLDAAGNLYITDKGNDRIRMISPDGKIKTVAGAGLVIVSKLGDGGLATDAEILGPKGVCTDAAGNYLYIADQANHLVRKVRLK